MEDSNVTSPGFITKLPIDPDRVLAGAVGYLDIAIVVGRNKETGQLWIASSEADAGTIGFWLDLAKHRNLMGAVGELIP